MSFQMTFHGKSTYLANGKSTGIPEVSISSPPLPRDYQYFVTAYGTWELGSGIISETLTKVNVVAAPSNKVKLASDTFEGLLKAMEGIHTESEILSYDDKNLVIKEKMEGQIITLKRVSN